MFCPFFTNCIYWVNLGMGREGETPAQIFWHIGVKKKWYKLSKLGGGVKVIWTQSKRTANFFPGDRPLGSWVDCCSAGICVIHTGPKSGGELVTLFGNECWFERHILRVIIFHHFRQIILHSLSNPPPHSLGCCIGQLNNKPTPLPPCKP